MTRRAPLATEGERVPIADVMDALKLAKEAPETWTAPALAKKTGLSEADMSAILQFCALPVLPERIRRS